MINATTTQPSQHESYCQTRESNIGPEYLSYANIQMYYYMEYVLNRIFVHKNKKIKDELFDIRWIRAYI